jgi:hypothetical protein
MMSLGPTGSLAVALSRRLVGLLLLGGCLEAAIGRRACTAGRPHCCGGHGSGRRGGRLALLATNKLSGELRDLRWKHTCQLSVGAQK